MLVLARNLFCTWVNKCLLLKHKGVPKIAQLSKDKGHFLLRYGIPCKPKASSRLKLIKNLLLTWKPKNKLMVSKGILFAHMYIIENISPVPIMNKLKIEANIKNPKKR